MWHRCNKATLRDSLIATFVTRGLNPPGGWGVARRRRSGHGEGPPRGGVTRRVKMSNLRDAVGLCMPYGKASSQYETEFEPATGTVWGYFNPKDGTPCYSLGLLKDILEHDQKLVADGCQVELDGMRHSVNYYVTGSR